MAGWRIVCPPAVLLVAALFFLPEVLFGEAIEVDVAAWADVGTGTTNGWEVSGISRTADGLTRVKEIADYARSPEFDFNVTQLIMNVSCSSAETKRFLTITPTISGTGAKTHVAERSTKLVEQTFAWEASEGVRQFRLQNETGEGTTSWGIQSLTVYTDRVGPPTELREKALYRDAFVASWDPAPKAVRYEVKYASVTRTPPSYETAAEWDFSSLTNATGNSKDLEALRKDFPEALDGVTGTNLGLQGYDGGHLQIGKSGVAGAMELSLDASAAPRVCWLTNWRHEKDSSSGGCSAFCLCEDGSTNAVAPLTVGAVPVTDEFVVPGGTRTLRVESVNARRIEVSSVVVAADYVPASVTTNGFSLARKTVKTERTLKNLASGEWVWSVRSFDAGGRDSPWAPLRAVTLDPRGPRGPFGFALLLR